MQKMENECALIADRNSSLGRGVGWRKVERWKRKRGRRVCRENSVVCVQWRNGRRLTTHGGTRRSQNPRPELQDVERTHEKKTTVIKITNPPPKT